MNRRVLCRLAAVAFVALLLTSGVAGQEAQHGSTQQKTEGNASAESSSGDANAAIGEILGHTVEKAAHTAENWGRRIGLGHDVSFAISLALNFAGIALFFYVLLKARLPQAFRERTATIKKAIEEARAAGADAARRLGDIESRLGRLDSEVSGIRAQADREAAAEEERIRQAAEEDKHKVVQTAEAEIAAIARNARRELKGYAASLAVDLAARRIRVDESTDHALVREFVEQLDKDGK
ncbi:MAG TPA: hypothetical protein VL240_04100 [Candidatus Binatia bacterium]|nr:hypothetical protein [Candidatus Binatia bacterium]